MTRTNEYEAYLKSPAWRRKRIQKINAGVSTNTHAWCRGCKCMVPKRWIHIHHRTYERLFNERLEDLAVLCGGCHAYLHDDRLPQWWKDARKSGKLGNFSKRKLLQGIKSGIGIENVNDMIVCMSTHIQDNGEYDMKFITDFGMQENQEEAIKERAIVVARRKARIKETRHCSSERRSRR